MKSGKTTSRQQRVLLKISYLKRAFLLIWSSTRKWMVVWGVILFLQGILPAVTVYLTKVLVDNLALAMGQGFSWESAQVVLWPALLMGATIFGGDVLGGINAWVRSAQAEVVQDYIKSLIHQKAAEVDLAFYETPEKADLLARANAEASSRSLSILQSFGSIIQNTLTLFAVSGLLIVYSWWLPLVLLVSTLPALWVVMRHNALHHNWWEKTTEDRRWVSYFDQILTYAFPAAEVRIFKLAPFYQDSYKTLRKRLRKSRLVLLRNQNIAQLVAGLLALCVTAVTIGWMGLRALRGTATLGDIALFYQAFNQGQKLMRSLLSSVGQLYGDALFIEHLFTFLDEKPAIKSSNSPEGITDSVKGGLTSGITFEDVKFSYPGSQVMALNGLNLHIPAGKTVAIVGPNGAGKSTVTKLLCRFYDPIDGKILWDGANLKSLDLDQLRAQCTVLFQHPMRFSATVGQNIAMGDIGSEINMERIKYAAEGGGAHEFITEMPAGYNTLLGKQFNGGVEMSGGQWQRVTLARAFYRQSPVVILDEPTSFMDSWAENIWLDRFKKLVDGRTAIIVTHRFTTAMRADIICVMEKGRVIEQGSHEELVALDGQYATSWKTQIQAGDAISESA